MHGEPAALSRIHRDANPRYLAFRTSSGARWLVPRGWRQRLAAARMFVPNSLLGWALRGLMIGGVAYRPDADATETVTRLHSAVVEMVGRDDLELVWYLGNRGVESKHSVLALDRRGRAVGFVKLAETAPARRALANERRVLELLAASLGDASLAPTPGGWREDATAAALLTSPAPPRAAPKHFGPLHEAFLGNLEHRFGTEQPFHATTAWRRMSDGVEAVAGRASAAWRARFAAAVARLERKLATEVVRTTLAHRDFTPWNTRRNAEALYVFDWEYASTGYPVTHDYFHFRFMTALLLRGGAGAGHVRGWLRAVPSQHARNADLLIAYLLDVALQYHGFDHSEGRDASGPVLDQAAELLDLAHGGNHF